MDGLPFFQTFLLQVQLHPLLDPLLPLLLQNVLDLLRHLHFVNKTFSKVSINLNGNTNITVEILNDYFGLLVGTKLLIIVSLAKMS